jgi:hypothetical protein
MNTRNLAILGVIFLMLIGAAFAASRTTAVTNQFLTRWSPTGAGTLPTEGGNISETNLTGTSLTDRWAGVFGNVSASVILSSGGNTVRTLYNWSWTATNGGYACASQGSAFDFAAASGANNGSVIAWDNRGVQLLNTQWGFAGAADNATQTFTGNCSALTFTQKTITGASRASHMGSSTFDTCVINDSTGAKTNWAFCSNISATGTNYFGNQSNFELILPVAYGAAQVETYYFYLELK